MSPRAVALVGQWRIPVVAVVGYRGRSVVVELEGTALHPLRELELPVEHVLLRP